MSPEAVLVELDQRRRVSLGKIGHEGHRRYLASVESDGTIVLTPAVVMTALEASFLNDPELVESIRRQRKDPSAYVKRPR
ncbi:MAG: hypothetical protein KJ698_01120 [Actinobacteria bacterium]|nr:hypothetical protein [Actinomycetota bacterium]MBU1492847.1 hypothetical protein [Actinomycetota bacterium]MBU1865200.1 hypothetical protein [Actinomycetota bacterium]